jgi:hypothetical protein
MALEQMSSREHAVIQGCLDAVISDIFIDAGEFETISGADFDTLGEVARAFPHVDDSREAIELAIHGALLVLQFYPHRQEKRWSEFVPASFQEVTAVHQRWMVLKGWAVPDLDHPGMYFFDLLR